MRITKRAAELIKEAFEEQLAREKARAKQERSETHGNDTTDGPSNQKSDRALPC